MKTKKKGRKLHVAIIAFSFLIILLGLVGMIASGYLILNSSLVTSPFDQLQKTIINIPLEIEVEVSAASNMGTMASDIKSAANNLGNVAQNFKSKYYACVNSFFSFLDPKCWVADVFLDIGNSLEATSRDLSSFSDNLRRMGIELRTITVPFDFDKSDLDDMARGIRQAKEVMVYLLIYTFILHFVIFLIGIMQLLIYCSLRG